MDDFVKKQLNHLGFTENLHNEIWLAFRDVNEADFLGLTVQKIRHLVPNRPEVQMEILAHIEVLRINAALATNQLNYTNSDGSQDPLVPIKVEVKTETVNYSSGSDIEILSSDDDTEPTVNKKSEAYYDNHSDEPVIVELVQPRSRRPTKRANLISLNEVTLGQEKVLKTEPNKSVSQVGESDPPAAVSTISDPQNTYSITILRVSRGETLSNIDHGLPRTEPTLKLVQDTGVLLAEELLKNTEENVTSKRNYETDKGVPTKSSHTYYKVNNAFIKSLEGIVQREETLPTRRNYSIGPRLQDKDLKFFYEQMGKNIQRLKLFSWSWRRGRDSIGSSIRENWWAKDLGKILYVLCPKVKVLVLQVEPNKVYGSSQISKHEQIRQLPNLREIFLINCSNEVVSQLERILKAGKKIWRFYFVFEEIDEVTRVFNLIQNLSGNNYLQELTMFGVRVEPSKWSALALNSEHLMALSSCNLPKLRTLQIDCNFHEECIDDFEAMLENFSAGLKTFRCSGSFVGTRDDYISTVVVPKMDNLTYFSLASKCTKVCLQDRNFFHERSEESDAKEAQPVRSENLTERVTEHEVLTYELQMCNIYPSMKTLVTGTVCIPEDMHFSSFPNLKEFEVGGPWDTTIKFPSSSSRRSNYPNIESIKIPESIENECIISDLPRVFPNLRKVSMKFPRARCLRNFFKVMVNSKLRELDLQTDFCFSWTLTEILIGKDHGGERKMAELRMAQDLMNYKEFKEFVSLYSLDFPFDILDPNDPDFEPREESVDVVKRIEFFNRQLKVFKIKHLGRRLEIPKGNFSFKDSRCEYFEEKIGFIIGYPLATHSLINGFVATSTIDDDRKYNVKNIDLSD